MMYLRTRQEIQDNLRILFPSIKDVSIEDNTQKRLVAIINVTLPWWKWLGLGIIHYHFKKKIELAFGSFGAAGVKYVVRIL